MLEAVPGHHSRDRRIRADHAPEIVSMFGRFEPVLYPLIEMFEVVSEVWIPQRRINRHSETVSQWRPLGFLATPASPEEFRQVSGGHQEALEGDKRAVNVARHKAGVDSEGCNRSSLALKGHLVLQDSQDVGFQVLVVGSYRANDASDQ